MAFKEYLHYQGTTDNVAVYLCLQERVCKRCLRLNVGLKFAPFFYWGVGNSGLFLDVTDDSRSEPNMKRYTSEQRVIIVENYNKNNNEIIGWNCSQVLLIFCSTKYNETGCVMNSIHCLSTEYKVS